MPKYIITDNGKPFFKSLMISLCEKFIFAQHKSSMYNALSNVMEEALHKTLYNLLKKVITKSKRNSHEKLKEALWTYQTMCKTPMQSNPFGIEYGVEDVLSL